MEEKVITLQLEDSIKINTASGESIRILVRRDGEIEIMGVEYNNFLIQPGSGNLIYLKLGK